MEKNSAQCVLELDSLETLEAMLEIEQSAGMRFDPNAGIAVIQVESWAKCVDEMREIFPLHWKELARFQEEIQMDVDNEKYLALEKAGILLLLTARCGGKLVGYFLGFVMTHAHYKSSGPWGMTDMYFVLPEFRNGTGLLLFLAFEQALRERGCVQAVTSCKIHEDHTEFLEKLGWTWTDKTFQKHLK